MTTREKLEHHISHLEEKIKQLKLECKEAYAQGSDLRWETLKKKKLKLKDEVEECRRQMEQLAKK